jgi:hypothetical protein
MNSSVEQINRQGIAEYMRILSSLLLVVKELFQNVKSCFLKNQNHAEKRVVLMISEAKKPYAL